jgi:hypothetical protein
MAVVSPGSSARQGLIGAIRGLADGLRLPPGGHAVRAHPALGGLMIVLSLVLTFTRRLPLTIAYLWDP